MYVDKIGGDFLHHAQSILQATFLKGWPVELFKHGRHATLVTVVTHDVADITALNLLQFLAVLQCMRIPGRSSVFDSWPNKGGINCFLDLPTGVAQVPGEEGPSAVGFLCYGIDMGIEVQM